MDFDRIPEIAKYLSVTFMVAWLGRNTVWYFLPVFIEQNISSVFLVGVITAISSIIPILLDIPVGQMVQRLGAKIVIFMGLVTSVFPGLAYVTAAPLLIVVGKVFEGLVKVLVWNGGWSLTLQSSDQAVESESVSVFLLGVNLAAVLGPVIGGYLIAANGFTLTFFIWASMAALSVMVYYSYIGIETKEPIRQGIDEVLTRETYHEEFHELRNYWRDLALPYTLIFLFSIIFSFYWVAVPLLLERVDAEYHMMGIVFGLAALPKVFQFVFGDLADNIGRKKVLGILAIVLVPVLVALNFARGVMVIGALFFIARLISEGMSPAIHAIFDERAPDDLQSEFTGFFEFTKHFGTAIGPIMAGAVADLYSVNGSFLAAAVVAMSIFAVIIWERI